MTENLCFMDRVESILKEKRLTQKELAEDLGLRRPTLSDWKKNGAVPAGDICIRIADYLGVSVEWLVTGKEAALSSEDTLASSILKTNGDSAAAASSAF